MPALMQDLLEDAILKARTPEEFCTKKNEKLVEKMIQTWDIVRCPRCKKSYSILVSLSCHCRKGM